MIIFGYEIRKARKPKTARERMDCKGYSQDMARIKAERTQRLREEVFGVGVPEIKTTYPTMTADALAWII